MQTVQKVETPCQQQQREDEGRADYEGFVLVVLAVAVEHSHRNTMTEVAVVVAETVVANIAPAAMGTEIAIVCARNSDADVTLGLVEIGAGEDAKSNTVAAAPRRRHRQ